MVTTSNPIPLITIKLGFILSILFLLYFLVFPNTQSSIFYCLLKYFSVINLTLLFPNLDFIPIQFKYLNILFNHLHCSPKHIKKCYLFTLILKTTFECLLEEDNYSFCILIQLQIVLNIDNTCLLKHYYECIFLYN